jgi:outer membrane protein assembly factor BamB
VKRILLFAICLGIYAADWPTESGSPQRDGWAKSETAFTRENVKGLELLYKYQADNQSRGPNALTTPMINGRVITYLGFKEELVFGGSSDNVFALDADLNRPLWKRHFDYLSDKPQAPATALCPGGMTAPVAMVGSSTAVAGRGVAGRGLPPGAVGRGLMLPPGRGLPIAPRGGNRSGEFFAVSSDGYLHRLNTSTGEDRVAPLKFLPPNSKVSALNVSDNTIYAATLDGCGGNANTLYAIDLSADNKVAAIPVSATSAGVAIGNNGDVYVRTNDAVLALAPKTLELKGRFAMAGGTVTPVVFAWHDKDVILAGGNAGRLALLDSASLEKPLAESAPTGNEFRGAFASWLDPATSTRWIYGATATGIEAWRVEDQAGKPVLTRDWVSKEVAMTAPPVTANGLVFALASGEASKHAVLAVLDGITGEKLFSNVAPTWSNSGLAVANKRIYFTTHDNTVYCFGFFADQPQLTGR